MSAEAEAAEITRASKSNLALAFVSMSGARRRDITTFYAFCRVVDDIADDPQCTPASKRANLALWRRSLRGKTPDEPALAEAVRRLIATYPITPEMLEEIISGVEMDVAGERYATWEELRVYCYRVASMVGLVSIEIFGYSDPGSREYAVQLGLALQLTNIIRDVGVDQDAGRSYLPGEEMAAFQYSSDDLAHRVYDVNFIALMKFEAARADEFFGQAAMVLPPKDRRSLLPAEIMRSIYQALLRKMIRDGFRVFEKQYRLSHLEKAARVAAKLCLRR